MANSTLPTSNTVGEIRVVVKYLDLSQPDRNFFTDQNDVNMAQQAPELVAWGGQMDPVFRQKRSLLLRFKNIVADGVTRTYTVTQDVVGSFTDLSLVGGAVGYLFESGTVEASLTAGGHLTATLKCTARNNSIKSVEIDGTVNLTGFVPVATANMFTARFEGGPFSGTTFNGTIFEVFKDDLNNWYTIARYLGPWPYLPMYLSIVVLAGAGNPPYDFADQSKVLCFLYDETTREEAQAIAGVVDFTSLPQSGRSTGTFHATVRFNQEPSYLITEGKFDITA